MPKAALAVSLRTALFVPVVLFALAAGILVAETGLREHQRDLARAEHDTLQLAERLAGDFKELVAAIQELSELVSLLPDVANRAPAGVEPLLRALVGRNPVYANILLTDDGGRVWASAIPLRGEVSLADRKYFAETRATGRFAAGEYTREMASGKPVLGFGYPLTDRGGRFRGCVAVAVDLEYFGTRRVSSLSPKVVFNFSDHRGIVLFRSPAGRDFVGSPLPPDLWEPMRAGPPTATSIGTGLDGVRRVRSYAKQSLRDGEPPYLYVRAGVAYDPIVAPNRSTLGRNIGSLGAVALALLTLSWYVGRHFVATPVAALERTLEQLGRGDLATGSRTPLPTRDFERLALSLDATAARLADTLAERHQAQAALAESEERFRLLLQYVPAVAVQGYGADGTTQYWNEASERLYGYTAAEALGKNLIDLIIPPEMADEVRGAVASMAQTGRPLPAAELSLRHKNGSRVDVYSSHAVVCRPGHPPELFCIDIDVGPRKRAEEEGARLLDQTRRDADTRERLLHEVNHRVKNNLVALLGLLLTEQRGTPPEGRAWVEASGERMAARIRGLLTAHEMLSASEWAPLPLAELAGRLVRQCLDSALAKGRLSLVVTPSDVHVSPRQTSSVALSLNELATNTLKFAASTRDHVQVGVRVTEDESFVTLEYRDDGPGYPEGVLKGEFPSTGLKLVSSLVSGTLRGSVSLSNEGGAVATLRLRKEDPSNT